MFFFVKYRAPIQFLLCTVSLKEMSTLTAVQNHQSIYMAEFSVYYLIFVQNTKGMTTEIYQDHTWRRSPSMREVTEIKYIANKQNGFRPCIHFVFNVTFSIHLPPQSTFICYKAQRETIVMVVGC